MANVELNGHLNDAYKKLLKVFAELDTHSRSIRSIQFDFYAAIDKCIDFYEKAIFIV